MNKPRFTRMVFLCAVIVIELAAIVMITKSIVRDTSPALGIVFLCVGMVMMIIAMATKPGKAS